MKRNSALKWTAWLGTLVIANSTKFGEEIEGTAALLIRMQSPTAPDVEAFAWMITFIILTALCMLASNIMLALWGETEQPDPVYRSSDVFDRAPINRLDER